MGQSLLDGSDASGVAAFDDIFDLFGKYQFFFLYNLTVFDDVDGDVVVDECQHIQAQSAAYVNFNIRIHKIILRSDTGKLC